MAWIAPSMRGWMFSWPGVAMNNADLALADELDDALAHRHARPEEILADVGHPGVRGVGVVRDDRDPGIERRLDRVVERLEIDDRHGDPVGPAGDRRFEGVDHLGDVGTSPSRSTGTSCRAAPTRPRCRTASG